MEKTALLLGESEHNLKEAGGEIPPVLSMSAEFGA